MYDFLLLIDCEFLWPMLYLAPFPRFSAVKEIENHLTLICVPFEETCYNFVVKLIMPKSWDISLHFSENRMVLALDARGHIMKVAELCNANCNVRLKIDRSTQEL